MGRRTLLFTAAVLVAALGTTLVFLYVRGVDTRARRGQELVNVLVAKGAITLGTSAADAQAKGLLQLVQVPRSAAAPHAVSRIDAFQDQVAQGPIFRGSQLQTDMFAPLGGVTVPHAAGNIVISIDLGTSARVAGFVQPGSKVTIFATSNTPPATTRVLLSGIDVVAVGSRSLVPAPTTDTGQAQPGDLASAGSVTLSVTQKNAQIIFAAETAFTLSLALQDSDTKIDPQMPAANAQKLFQP